MWFYWRSALADVKQEKKDISPYRLHFLPVSLEPKDSAALPLCLSTSHPSCRFPSPTPLQPCWLLVLSYFPYPPLPPSPCPREELSGSTSCLTGIRGTRLGLPRVLSMLNATHLLLYCSAPTLTRASIGPRFDKNRHSQVTATKGASRDKPGESLTGLDSRLMGGSGQVKTGRLRDCGTS